MQSTHNSLERPLIMPAWLHELFGEKTTWLELILVFVTSITGCTLLYLFNRSEWLPLPWWRSAIMFLLTLDMMAGFVANLTRTTNDYYAARPRLRIVFIAIHAQPLLFWLLFREYGALCLSVWAATMAASLLANSFRSHYAQRALGGALAGALVTAVMLQSSHQPVILTTALTFYILKLVFSFAVDHRISDKETN